MPAPLLRLGRCVLIVAMFFAIGGHWAVLQTVAWSGMIIDYSRTSSLTTAVEKTFSGNYPCDMCQSIAKSRQGEEKSTPLMVMKKLDVFHETTRPFIAPAVSAELSPLADFAAPARTLAPTLRPPRSV